MPATLTAPDVRQLAGDGLPRSGFPASPRADFRVYFAPEAHAAVWRHAGENRSVEICGVLVGRCLEDDDGPFVSITHTIRCDEATSKFAEVTFTHESWAKINAEMDTKYADLRIVGWYHTHPDFGIFLSERDTFIHQNFFSNPGQVAHVVDPVRNVEGVFTWQQGKPVPCSHFWVGDRIQLDGSGERSGSSRGPTVAAGAPGAAAAESRGASPTDDAFLPMLRAALPLVLMFLVGFLFSGLMTGWRSEAEHERMFRAVLAEAQLNKVLRPGLTEQLDRIERHLDAAGARLRDLATDHLEHAGDAGADRESWARVFDALHESRRLARDARNVYGLNPEETAALEAILARQAERAEAAAAAAAEAERKQQDSETKSGEKPSGAAKPAGGKESSSRNPGKESNSKPAAGSPAEK
ncbi:MAG TPA: Mov34/MPN/PAD-1 family protein [Planctomycetaceae bacterium]|nr:Mov34/MPN/PAD-1 family protein [Planctomycetaceae bacterium]